MSGNRNWWLCVNKESGRQMATLDSDAEIETLVRTGMWDVKRCVVMSKDAFDEMISTISEESFELGVESVR